MTGVNNAVPSPFQQLTTTAQWELFTDAIGALDRVIGIAGGTSLRPSLDIGGRNIVIQPGNVLIGGALWGCTLAQSTAIPVASGSNRIDILTMELNRAGTTPGGYLSPLVVTGSPSATPVPPALTNNATITQIPVAQWNANSDGSLTGLKDLRQFGGNQPSVFTSTSRPGDMTGIAIGLEADTSSIMLWNGTQWTYLISPAESASGFVLSDVNISASGSEATLATCSFSGDGSTDFEFIGSVPGFNRGPDSPLVTGIVNLYLDGTRVDRKWFELSSTLGANESAAGVTLIHRTSPGKDTPGAGSHTLKMTAQSSIGNHSIVAHAASDAPIKVQVGPIH